MAEHGENLPSFGMSRFVDVADEDQLKKLMSNIREGSNISYLPGPSFPKTSENSKSSSSDDDQEFRSRGQRSSSPVSMETSGPSAGTSRVVTHSGNGKTFTDLKPMVDTSTNGTVYKNVRINQRGRTIPIETPMSTIDMSQLNTQHISNISDDQLFDSGEENKHSPKMEIWTTSYNRFRYPSERNKGKKRQYEMDEEKSCLATVSMDNYEGAATIIAYCVDKDGNLHPFGMYGGDSCTNGVYKTNTTFGKRCKKFKINKVSITSAKISQYQTCLKVQRAHLKTFGVCGDKSPGNATAKEVDKQIVYIMFKIKLSDGSILSQLSTAVNNKKEGSEFKIHTIVPPSAPACGPQGYNVDSLRVLLVVTENTAFPKDVGVVFRSKTNGWEKILKGQDIHVIKKAVVEFLPPPYKETDIELDVEVDISLKDLKTGNETEPAIFTFTSKYDYGLGPKGKKRKLEEQQFMSTQTLQEKSQRKTLQAARSKKAATATSSDSSFESSGSSTENSLTEFQVQQPQTMSSLAAPGTTPQDRVISLGTARQSSPLPFTNYSPASLPANVTAELKAEYSAANMGSPGFDVSHILSQQQGGTNVSSPGFLSQADNQNYGSANSATVVTSTMSVFSTQPTSTQSMQSMPTLSYSHQNLNNSTVIDPQQAGLLPQPQNQHPNIAKVQELLQKFQEEEQQKNPQATFNQNLSLNEQVVNLSKEKKMALFSLLSTVPQTQTQEQSSPLVDLPPLGPNMHYAIINGQILVVKDDTTTATPSSVQDIAGQQVLVQPVPLQQPSDEACETSDQLLTFTESFGANMSTLSGTMTNQTFQQSVNGGMNAYQQLQNQQGFNFGASNYQLATGQSGVNFPQNPAQQPNNPTQPLEYQRQQYQQQQQMTGHQNQQNQFQNPSTSNNEPLFWRSVIPSTPCNLDDDDVEIDSGPANDNSGMQGKTQITTNTASNGNFRNYSSSRGSSPFSDRPSSRGSSSNDVEVDGVVYDVEETTGNLKYANVANDDANDVNLESLTLDHDYDNHDNS